MPQRTKPWYIVLIALMVVVAFQLLNLNSLNMHPDEELSYRATNGTLADTLYFQTSVQDNQAPLWFISFWAWRTLVGDAEFTSRVFGLLLAALALAVTTHIARRAFGRWDIAALSLLLLTGNAFFFNYALDIRPYPMVMLAAATCTWALQRWLAHGGRRDAFIYGASIALVLYVHYLLIFLVLAHIVYVLFTKRLTIQVLGQSVLAGVVGLVIWLPWLPHFLNQVVGLRNIETASGTGRGIAGIGVSTQATTLPTIVTLLNTASNNQLWLYGLVLVISLIGWWRHKGYWLALIWFLLTPAVYLLANTVAAVYAPRFVSHALLGLGITLGAGLVQIPTWWRRLPVRAVAVTVFVGLNVLTFYSLLPVRIPYRQLFRELSAEAAPDDVVLIKQAHENDPFQQFMFATYLSPELNRSITLDPKAAFEARRVWYITAEWFADDVQQVFRQLERSHPLQEVKGQCDLQWCYLIQLLQAPPLASPNTFGDVLPFYGVDQISLSPGSLSARLWWRADTTPTLDYSIGLHLLATDGALVAQTDGSINHYSTQIVPTSQMQAGQIYIDYRTMSLPNALATGSYTLSLVVYQSWDNARLKLPNGADHMVLQTITIE